MFVFDLTKVLMIKVALPGVKMLGMTLEKYSTWRGLSTAHALYWIAVCFQI